MAIPSLNNTKVVKLSNPHNNIHNTLHPESPSPERRKQLEAQRSENGQWKRIVRYTGSGGLMIDNYLIENQIRALALAIKNYLFVNNYQGTKNSAIIYLLIGSCVRNHIGPFQHLYAILTKIPDYPVNKISGLLPCNITFEKKSV